MSRIHCTGFFAVYVQVQGGEAPSLQLEPRGRGTGQEEENHRYGTCIVALSAFRDNTNTNKIKMTQKI
jgi:hypothetical protein